MKEHIDAIREALYSCVTLSNGWEHSFDEDKVNKALIHLTALEAMIKGE
jgi:hypothetical protein